MLADIVAQRRSVALHPVMMHVARTARTCARDRAAPSRLARCAACGKKGPPLAPLHLAPEAPEAVVARPRSATTRLLQIRRCRPRTPTGPARISLDRVEVYAVTLAPGATVPPNRELLKPKYVVANDSRRAAAGRRRAAAGPGRAGDAPAPGDTVDVRRDADRRDARRRVTMPRSRREPQAADRRGAVARRVAAPSARRRWRRRAARLAPLQTRSPRPLPRRSLTTSAPRAARAAIAAVRRAGSTRFAG